MKRPGQRIYSSSVILVAVAGLLPAAPRAEETEVLVDLPYVHSAAEEQRLDFYWPSDGADETLLFIHGGSLQESGERRSSEAYVDICVPFVDAGVACATMDYRLHPTHKWPAMPDDVVSAFIKVRELVEARNGDPERIFLMGHSSGCSLAATVGTNPVFLAKRDLEPSSIAGVVAMGCILDNYDAAFRGATAERVRGLLDHDAGYASLYSTPENWISAVPSFHIGEHMPPTLVVVARRERFFPAILEQGARFVRLALELRRPADLVIVPGKHMSSIADLGNPGDPTLAAILAFLDAPTEAGQDSR